MSMRTLVLSVVVIAFAAAPALAQSTPPGTNPATGARPGNEIGTGNSLPLSSNASNIIPSDTHSAIAPRLPNPGVGEGADPRVLLDAAKRSLAAKRTGEAQEALERAETRLLDRSVAPADINAPDASPAVADVNGALHALGAGDWAKTVQMIDAALSKLPTQ
jgi:hypothetical protein